MFGCAWKIIFWKLFQLTRCFEGFDSEMVWSENFHFKPFPDSRTKRERERESLRLRLRRLCQSQPSTSTLPIYKPIMPSTLSITLSTSPTSPITAFDFDFADLWTHRSMNRSRLWLRQLRRSRLRLCWSMNRSTNPRIDLRPRAFDPRTFDFTGDPEPSRHESIFDPKPRTHEPISLFVWFWFSMWFSVWFWSTHEPTSLWSLIFLLLLWWCGWWCFGGYPVLWWWVLCGWWWEIAFSECYQIHENIF